MIQFENPRDLDESEGLHMRQFFLNSLNVYPLRFVEMTLLSRTDYQFYSLTCAVTRWPLPKSLNTSLNMPKNTL